MTSTCKLPVQRESADVPICLSARPSVYQCVCLPAVKIPAFVKVLMTSPFLVKLHLFTPPVFPA